MYSEMVVLKEKIAPFCEERCIKWLAVLASDSGRKFGPDSEVNVLVDFDPGRVPGLLGMARIERELSPLFGGRRVGLRTPEDLSKYVRDRVVGEAEVQYGRR